MLLLLLLLLLLPLLLVQDRFDLLEYDVEVIHDLIFIGKQYLLNILVRIIHCKMRRIIVRLALGVALVADWRPLYSLHRSQHDIDPAEDIRQG